MTSAIQREIESFLHQQESKNVIKKLDIHYIPMEYLPYFALKKHGDFCVTKDSRSKVFLSVMATKQTESGKVEQIINLPVLKIKDEYCLRGFMYNRAPSIKKLITDFRHNPVNVLSGVLDADIQLTNQVDIAEIAKKSNVFIQKQIRNKTVLTNDYNFNSYSGEISLCNNQYEKVVIFEPSSVFSVDEFRRKIFEEIHFRTIVQSSNLPIRVPLAAIIEPPALIYPSRKGYTLEYLVDANQHCMDLSQRIKICASCVRIMSEILTSEYYHGGVQATNFYATLVGESKGIRQFEIVFNGADGLTPVSKTKKIYDCIDYDLYAPEVAFTRTMTTESCVYNIGRLISKIIEPNFKDNCEIMVRMRHLIADAMRLNPAQRPSMHGLLLVMRQLLTALPPSRSNINIVHFDQYNNN